LRSQFYIARDYADSQQRSAHPVTLCDAVDLEYIRKEAYWAMQTIDLLSKLRHRFSMMFEAWGRFNSPHGDIEYFAGVPRLGSDLALSGIKESFQKLMDLETRLRSINQSCETDWKIVS
jgi:hypothetical protein